MAENQEGQEKTEQATSKKISDAREKGQVAKSQELPSALLLFTAALMLLLIGKWVAISLGKQFLFFYDMDFKTLDEETVIFLFYKAFSVASAILIPIMMVVAVVGIMAHLVQFGTLWATKAINPDFTKLNVIKGIRNMFKLTKLVELGKSLSKIFIVGAICLPILYAKREDIVTVQDGTLIDATTMVYGMVIDMFFRASAVVIILALADLLYQKWNHMEQLKMTQQEVKEEHKQMEGDPLLRQRIRQAQMDASRARMMDDVPSSDVVITNPTHYAVAVRYNPDEGDRAPKVIAKGKNMMALRIREIAKEHSIHIHEDPLLARTLYNTAEIGDEIPESLYKAIAEIISFVYKLKGKKIA